MTSPDLGPLPEPVAWFRAPYGTLEPNPLFRVSGPQSLAWAVACFTEDQMRAYALQEVAKERERRAKLCDLVREFMEFLEPMRFDRQSDDAKAVELDKAARKSLGA